MVYEITRVGDTVWLAFFLTDQPTNQGVYARWGYPGPITTQNRDTDLIELTKNIRQDPALSELAVETDNGTNVTDDDITCANVYYNDGGTAMQWNFPIGSFDDGARVEVITNLGQLGYRHTYSWGPM